VNLYIIQTEKKLLTLFAKKVSHLLLILCFFSKIIILKIELGIELNDTQVNQTRSELNNLIELNSFSFKRTCNESESLNLREPIYGKFESFNLIDFNISEKIP
jgi:hypothetical protein